MEERFLEKSTFFFMMASPLFGFITVILWLICKILNIPLHISIHDYTVLCPRINLITETGMYCGEPNEKNCDNCALAYPKENSIIKPSGQSLKDCKIN